MEENRRRSSQLILIVVILLIVIIITLAIVCVKLWLDKTRTELLAAEYRQSAAEFKESYDKLIEEIKTKEQDAASYQLSFNQLTHEMLNIAADTETEGNLIIAVWHNAIWKEDDEETDKFTKNNGSFVEDFNDALNNLFNDRKFINKMSKLSEDQLKVKNEMKNMLSPPEGFENAFKALESMYNSFIRFTDIVLNCKGSLESFSNSFSDADSELINLYHAAELYTK